MRSLVLSCILAALPQAVNAAGLLESCNVVWSEPSGGSSGSMPIGNGDTGLNVWVEKGGDLKFYISKTDAFSGLGRLLKLGGIRIHFEPNPFVRPSSFRQVLDLTRGTIKINAVSDSFKLDVKILVDANNPVIHVDTKGNKKFNLKVYLDVWRTEPRELTGSEANSARGIAGGPVKLIVEPDTVLPPQENRLVWFHHNTKSVWPVTMKHQGAGALLDEFEDPLKDRIFGAAMEGKGLKASGSKLLVSEGPSRSFHVSIYPLTLKNTTPARWRSRLEKNIKRLRQLDFGETYEAHCLWWNEFWNRSWIYVTNSGKDSGWKKITPNNLPLRIGADSNGGSSFAGDIAGVWIYDHALSDARIKQTAVPAAPDTEPAPLVSWNFEEMRNNAFQSSSGEPFTAKKRGNVRVAEIRGQAGERLSELGAGRKAVRLEGKGYLEVAHHPKLNLEKGCTLAAWIRPGEIPRSGGRIIDKIYVGKDIGYLLDTYPGRSLRMIVPAGTLIHRANLPKGRWVHVAGTYSSRTGVIKLYINGKLVKSSKKEDSRKPHQTVSQGYALQRFINACGGRGGLPIKFNGTIFTVDGKGYNADYRRWGGMYWWQNTRLPYWTMPAAGDFDLMSPLFKMYMKALPLRKRITKLYYRHEGAFYPETMYFFGMPGNCDYGWNRGDQPVHLMLNRYIKREWQGGIELTCMMLDVYDYTQNELFLEKTLLPFACEITRFYDSHYKRDEKGKLYIHPAQALETWQEATNPMPETAGLKRILDRLLKLPEEYTTEKQRKKWKQLSASVPDLPVGKKDGKKVLLPADKYGRLGNIENPELYAVFPYRLFGVGKPDLALARRTFALRRVKGSRGWQQDPVQAALLGLTGQARQLVVNRFAVKHAGSRFPAFWGPNFDWIPDQDHGSNGMMGLQAMLLQCEGKKMVLFPAWPEDWDVDFKLNAPMKTTVQGKYEEGELVELKVIPARRKEDLEILKPGSRAGT